MSVRVATDEELHELCVHTLAWHGNRARGGLAGDTISSLFTAVRVAQHVAYVIGSDDETITLPAKQFPTSPTPGILLSQIDLAALYEGLAGLKYNVTDRHGITWLPDRWLRTLDHLITCTAVKAARF